MKTTSGLDGQAAFNNIRFLKKLAAAWQAILVTIHQPSAQLFAEFDTLLLSAKGGNTVYFTLVGHSGVLVPYSQIVDFWKYWLYYIDPFIYLLGSLLIFTSFSIDV